MVLRITGGLTTRRFDQYALIIFKKIHKLFLVRFLGYSYGYYKEGTLFMTSQRRKVLNGANFSKRVQLYGHLFYIFKKT